MNKIRSKVVKESLLDYNTLANSLKENTESAVKTLLDEAVRDTYAKLLSEGDEDYEEEEVEDTSSDTTNDVESSDAPTDGVEDTDAGKEEDLESTETDEFSEEDKTTFEDDGEDESFDEFSDGEGEGEEWADFEKYKVSDDEYDFTNAEDEEIVKVYKLMKNDDQVLVHKDDNGNVNIQDNETGAEYILSLGGDSAPSTDDALINDSAEDEFDNEFDDMNESTEKVFELVMEYNSNVGYTDNYQKKDVMTNDGMSEPGKKVNDWDAGVPSGTKKPWSGKSGDKSNKPFNGKKAKTVEEEVDVEGTVDECGGDEMVAELKTVQQHTANVGTTSRTDGPNNPRMHKGRSFHTAQNGQERGTADNPYQSRADESLERKVNKIFNENKELKNALTDVMKSLKEAAVTNHNLGMIIKLISENTTSQDEKQEIISRFSKEAKTVDASRGLYESISRDLKKSAKMNITEDKSLTVEGSKKINETTIYKSQDMLDSLDLMHRMMK